jgi:hypothetical protein
MADQPKTAEELQARIIVRAWEDEAFKDHLLSDPKSAIGEELGVQLPDELEITVVEETEQAVCLVIPRRPDDSAGDELEDDDLDAVAGGTGVVTYTRLAFTPTRGGFAKLGHLTTTMRGMKGYKV